MISFLFSFRLFCFMLFLQSTFFLFVNLFIYFATTIILQCGEKLSRVGKIITDLYLSYPGQANFSNISSQNEAGFLHERQKVSSTRRVTHQAGLPFCPGKVTFLAKSGPTFLHTVWLAQQNQLRQDKACASAVSCGHVVVTN